MTVKELIVELSMFKPDLEVAIPSRERDGYHPVGRCESRPGLDGKSDRVQLASND
jgi:hypothetical protein